MASKITFKQWQVAEAAALAAVQLSPLVDTSLRKLVAPVLAAGENPPGLQPWHEVISRLISVSAQRLIDLEDHYAQAQLAERARRTELGTLAERLRQELVQTRNLLRQAFGVGKGIELVATRLSLAAASPPTLARVGRQAIETMRAPGFSFPAPVEAVASMLRPDPQALALAIEQVLLPVEALLGVQKPGHQVTEIGKGARDTERAELKDRVQRGLKFLDGIFRLAGLDYHAERLRAAARRRRPGEVGEEEPGGADAAGGAPTPLPTQGRRRRKRRRVKVVRKEAPVAAAATPTPVVHEA